MRFDAGHVTVHHHAVGAACHVFGVVPALLFDLLGLGHVLAVGRRRVGVAAIGADHAVDYKTADFADVLKAAVPQGFQVIVDPVAGDYLPKNLQVLSLDGRIVVLAMLGGRTVPAFDLSQMFKKRGQLICSTLRNRTDEYKTELVSRFLAQFGTALDAGLIQPVIAKVLPWQQADDAHQLLAGNQLIGKVVLTLG